MTFVRTRHRRKFFVIIVVILMSAVWGAEASGHPPIVVNTYVDTTKSDGFCSLREAIISANKDNDSTGDCVSGTEGELDVVQILSGTYTLTKDDNGRGEDSSSSGDLDIDGDLRIEAVGEVIINTESGFKNRVFHIISGSVVIQDLRITGGSSRNGGGGILNQGDLTLNRVTVTSNVAGSSGGAIKNEGTLTLLSSTLNGNMAGENGGAISTSGTLNASNSTISGNLADGHGGGIHVEGGNTTLNNVTIAYNTADSDIDKKGRGDGGGVSQSAGLLRMSNTIVGANFDASPDSESPDCSGSIDSLGYNLIQNHAGCSISGILDGNLPAGEDPVLRPLTINGGTTFTHALAGFSPAIDAGNPGTSGTQCEATDQRGVSRTAGSACDIGAFEADPSVPPALIRFIGIASGTSGSTTVEGLVPGFPDTQFTLRVYAGDACDSSITSETPILWDITTDENGYFSATFTSDIAVDDFVAATVTSSTGDESPLSLCVVAGFGNDSWPTAWSLSGSPISHFQYLDTFGQSLWFKFEVQPGSQLIVTLTGPEDGEPLPANYDLTVYKDIAAAYNELTTTDDLERLSAEFAPSAFSPSAFSPSAFSPSAFSPSAFSPSAFSPSAFSPSAFSPSAFSPSAFSPSAFSPSAFSPSAFSPSAFSPDAWSPSAFSPSAFSPSAFSPSAFSPSAFSPSAFSPSAFSSAQMQSLIGVSAFDGTAGEGLVLNTWNNTGYFYVRVRGREGAFSLDGQFRLGIVLNAGQCGSVSTNGFPSMSHSPSSDVETVIITDLARMEGSADEKWDLWQKLQEFAGRSEVSGEVVNVGAYQDLAHSLDLDGNSRVIAANLQANEKPECPFSKNLVADTIKEIINTYRPGGLKYIVLVGNDDVVPFYRHPDQTHLGPESQYVPPVLDNTASQASLRLNYVLSQLKYGADISISYGSDEIPVPDLAVGRLVETPAEAIVMLDAYLQTGTEDGGVPGVIPSPQSSLVTGYDFLQDVADEIQYEFETEAGFGDEAHKLITPDHLSPASSDPLVWSADNLSSDFLEERHDIVFLAGHFSASSALAADYETSLTTHDFLSSDVDFTNSIIFSAGCHSGYNIVNAHGAIGVTFEPDWAQAFAQEGATFIGGTGYQYGDTEFLEYSERIYLEFTRQLRAVDGPASIGNALVAAKQAYLANTPQLRGIHAKAFLEATLFGLPMISVDMPGAIYQPPSIHKPSINLQDYGDPEDPEFEPSPGAALGLEFADIDLTPAFVNNAGHEHSLELTNYDDPLPDPPGGFNTVQAFYLSGINGVVSNPAEPILPLELLEVQVPGTVLRGVGFRGGSYTDTNDVLPLTGAPTTEVRGVHTPFHSSVLYPVRPWNVNYFDSLSSGGSGMTQLAVTPAQFISDASDPAANVGTLRRFNLINFRMFYSSNTTSETDPDGFESVPGLAAPPTIVNVSSTVSSIVNGSSVNFNVVVVDNPAAGIQEVWATYTDLSNPGTWISENLMQDTEDTTLWTGSISADDPSQIRYIVQAVNGAGLVSMATNLGSFYTPGAGAGQGSPTSLALSVTPDDSGDYGSQISVSATLSADTAIPDGKIVTFFLGSVGRIAQTEGGVATATLPILALPGKNEVVALFSGDTEFAPSGDSIVFTISKRDTQINSVDPNPPTGFASDEVLYEVSLAEANPDGRTIPEQTIIFNVSDGGGIVFSTAVITDYLGRARLGNLPLPPGSYSVDGFFSGDAHGFDFTHEDDHYWPSSKLGVSLTLLNNPPVAVDDLGNLTLEDTPLDIDVLANDIDVEGDTLSVSHVSDPPFGSATIDNVNNTIIYTPDPDYNGPDTFTYLANDGELDSVSAATVTVTVTAVNDPPVAVDDAGATDDFTPIVIDVLVNDTDVEGDTLSVSLDTQPTNGSAKINDDDTITYTPDVNFSGSDTFTYFANDGFLESEFAATVTINVTLANRPPSCALVSAFPDHLWSPNDKFRTVTLSGAIDPEEDPWTLIITGVWQDEPVGTEPDAILFTDEDKLDSADLRKERDGDSDGRVYHVFFEVTDIHGAACVDETPDGFGVLRVAVNHDNSDVDFIDGGAVYDSTKPDPE